MENENGKIKMQKGRGPAEGTAERHRMGFKMQYRRRGRYHGIISNENDEDAEDYDFVFIHYSLVCSFYTIFL